MKLIILISILFSFNSFAGFMSKDKIGDCSYPRNVYIKKSVCESQTGKSCIQIPTDYSCKYFAVIPETQMKEDVESCSDESDCQSKVALKECTSSRASAIYTLEPNEVYCTWVRPENVSIDSVKKSDFDAKELKRSNRALRKKRGAIARQKCKDALDYVSGGNLDADLTEEQIDAMEAAFADILKALQNNRPGKALRLINLVTDPTYADMKENLIEILQ